MKKMVLFAVLLSLSCSGYAHAADSTAFDPTRVRIQAQNSIPVGTIIAWHSTGNPADMRNPDGTYNWLECNGQSVSRTVYPELFAASLSKTFMAYQDRTVPSTTVTGSASGTVSGTASSSSVTGRLTNGTVTGTIGSGGGDETYAAGDAETAPRHVYVRYFIRARP